MAKITNKEEVIETSEEIVEETPKKAIKKSKLVGKTLSGLEIIEVDEAIVNGKDLLKISLSDGTTQVISEEVLQELM
jgi:hypothetical protein